MPAFLAEDFRLERWMEDAVPIDFEDIEKIRWVDRREGEDGVVVVGERVEEGRHARALQFGERRLHGEVERTFADAMLDDMLDARTVLRDGEKRRRAEVFRIVAFETEHFHAARMAESLGRDAKLRDFRC